MPSILSSRFWITISSDWVKYFCVVHSKIFSFSFFSFIYCPLGRGVEVSIIRPRLKLNGDRLSGCPWYGDCIRICVNFKRPISMVGVDGDISSLLLRCGMLLLLRVSVFWWPVVRRWILGVSRAHSVEVEWNLLAWHFWGNYGNFHNSQLF